ncbi:unnamed protein product [Peronospora belbahrii]|uniref:RING-type domain-containing protein n=1 Tax=Peronospora belbahrii TaxID=622444 RepID=A0ABN8CKR2_9STRA|nr:unnamed protein product [Peronospora belbahrii]
MAFRGMLLQLVEAKSEASFHVVAPDAELIVPHQSSFTYETFLTKWRQQKLVIADAVSRKLLQVTQLATVSLQQEENSVLWGVRSYGELSEGCRDNAEPLMSHVDVLNAVEQTLPGHKLVMTQNDASLQATAVASLLCYCFHFRSKFEYELFAQTLAAFTRMQQYALLQSSVLIEMEISHEHKKWSMEKDVRAKALVSKFQQKLEVVETKKEEKEEEEEKKKKKSLVMQQHTTDKNEANVVIATLSGEMFCVLCRIQREPNAPEYPKHPFVLKDGKGKGVHICKVCLQQVLKQRLSVQASAKMSGQDNMCGLCAQSFEKMSAKSVKACAHEVCPRVYCIPCIDKLIGKARVQKVLRTKNWLCPNCSMDNDSASADERANSVGSMSVEIVEAASAPRQKKRKRRKEIAGKSGADEKGPLEPSPLIPACSTSEMKLIDYAATYFKFLLKREKKDIFKESEDVCFCCKDGGGLIECDWKGMNGTFERCPKVYHEDCLGYKVPEGKTWVCPRHRCQDCGIIAQYSCRFCVTSYCEDHLPKEVKTLGHATKDIPTSTYVMCPRCNQQANDAFEQKKVSSSLHAKLFRRRRAKRY